MTEKGRFSPIRVISLCYKCIHLYISKSVCFNKVLGLATSLSVKVDFYAHIGNVYWSSMMTITGVHVMKYQLPESIVLGPVVQN